MNYYIKSKFKKRYSILVYVLTVIFSFSLGMDEDGFLFAQRVAINSTGALPNASALLDIDAAPGNNMGILIPRIALTQTSSNAPIGASIATSLLVYNTASIN